MALRGSYSNRWIVIDDDPNRSKQVSLINDEDMKEKNDEFLTNIFEEVVEWKDSSHDENKKECIQCN